MSKKQSGFVLDYKFNKEERKMLSEMVFTKKAANITDAICQKIHEACELNLHQATSVSCNTVLSQQPIQISSPA